MKDDLHSSGLSPTILEPLPDGAPGLGLDAASFDLTDALLDLGTPGFGSVSVPLWIETREELSR